MLWANHFIVIYFSAILSGPAKKDDSILCILSLSLRTAEAVRQQSSSLSSLVIDLLIKRKLNYFLVSSFESFYQKDISSFILSNFSVYHIKLWTLEAEMSEPFFFFSRKTEDSEKYNNLFIARLSDMMLTKKTDPR